MKGLLIDPTTRTITETEIGDGIQPIYDAIKANGFDIVPVDRENDLFVDDEYLLHANEESRWFVMLNAVGEPLAMIGGRALLLGRIGCDHCGTGLKPEHIKDAVRWVSDDAGACELAERMCDATTVCFSQAELDACRKKHRAMLHDALQLTP